MEEKLTTLEKYGYIYHMVGMNPITRKELREKIKKDSPKMSETTLKKYSDAPFDGAYPMFVVKEDKATLDITAFRSFIEELCKYVGTDAAVLFTGPAPAPGGRKGDNPQIAKVPSKAENPQILIERKKNTELSKQIADLEKQIEELRLVNQKIVADSVLANMSKEVNISTVRVFGKAVEEDIEYYSVIRALGAVRRADVCLMVVDSKEGLSEQDVKICGYIHEQGKPSVIVMNKWDLIEKDTHTVNEFNKKLECDLAFMDYFTPIYVSAKNGQRVDKILGMAVIFYTEMRKMHYWGFWCVYSNEIKVNGETER